MEKIQIIRKKIDKIDDRVIDLLNKRAKFVLEIGIIKKRMNSDIVQPQREQEILERLKKKSLILKKTSIEAIWKEILNACRLIQN